MLNLVDVFVDESVVQKTMAVVKPEMGSAGSNTIVKGSCIDNLAFYQASWERMQTSM